MKAFRIFTVILLVVCCTVSCAPSPAVTPADVTPTTAADFSDRAVSSQASLLTETVSSEVAAPKKAVAKSKAYSVSISSSGFKGRYNTNLNIEDNVFMDALLYTGYNMNRHRADGNMWTYILSEHKRGLGYLSNITYGGGSTGLETTPDGKPDIKAFERGGLVCASFATYVYFNYLPNVAGIDTSSLTRPERTYNAHSFYIAAKDWIRKGYSRSIGFSASRTGDNYIVFRPEEEIPIGSIIVFEDDRKHDGMGSHIVIYGGYKNGHHWVYQVGTKNGPEMSAVERMLFGPDPQWPLMIISTPANIRMSAMLELQVKDQNGKPLAGVSFSLKEKATGKTMGLGKTNAKGILVKEGLAYGGYQLLQTVPKGYAGKTSQTIVLTPERNSRNVITVTDRKKKPLVTATQIQ